MSTSAAKDLKLTDKQGTRQRLVSTARELFYSQGYHATGVQQILRAAEVNSGSLYHFFGGKEDLLLAVLDEYVEMLEPSLIEPILIDRDLSPLKRIMVLIDGYRRLLLDSDFERGCPIGNLALEIGDQCDEVRNKIAANFAGWRHWVAEWVMEEGATESIAEETAQFVLAVMEGAIMQARISRSIEPFDASARGIERYLEQL